MIKLIHGDCLEEMGKLENESVEAIVSDPPYELGFMGKKWDSTGIAYNVELWKECLRVLKPGGHLLAFGGTRTYHRMAVAIEDAGFEVRDMLEWIYASGFPKSRNIGLDIDKINGITKNRGKAFVTAGQSGQKDKDTGGDLPAGSNTIGAYKAQNEYNGFGTALKPAHEPIIMARKPLSEKTIVENVLKYGTGAIDIDGCRIPFKGQDDWNNTLKSNTGNIAGGTFKCSSKSMAKEEVITQQGRFPANIICTDDALNDGVMTKSGAGNKATKNAETFLGTGFGGTDNSIWKADSGSKSRYFDIDVWGEKQGMLQFPKASKRMKVLIACEESQAVCKAFRKLGHEAYSCDILPCSGGHPEWHIQGDVLEQLDKGWDLMIAHPPCTDLAVSGAAWFKEKIKDGRQQRALDFVQKLLDAPIPKIALENPVGVISTKIRKPDQTIQPYQFGDSFSKKTCLWLKGLPSLVHTKIVDKGEFITYASGKRMPKWYAEKWGKGGERSKTFQGIADAMAEQWGGKVDTFNQDVWGEKHGLLQFPKASKRERNEGCEGLPLGEPPASARSKPAEGRENPLGKPRSNHHPCVKPISVMSWLIRLVSKEGDTVLDPFMGSGTTGVACKKLDRNFIGIELSSEYYEIAEKRINNV